MLGDHGMTVTSLHRGGAFPASDERRRRAEIEHSRRAIDLAAEVGPRCLVLFVGGLADGSKDKRVRVNKCVMGSVNCCRTPGRHRFPWQSNRNIRCVPRIAPA